MITNKFWANQSFSIQGLETGIDMVQERTVRGHVFGAEAAGRANDPVVSRPVDAASSKGILGLQLAALSISGQAQHMIQTAIHLVLHLVEATQRVWILLFLQQHQ